MISDLKDYKPAEIDYVLSEHVKEKFPETLDFSKIEGMKVKNLSDAIKFIGKNFAATFPENEMVERKLDDFEIRNIREEYCVMQENDIPLRKQELEETLELIKSMKKKAEDRYNSGLLEVATYAAQVKKGTKEMRLNSQETFCIALSGYYLIYTYDKENKVFVLAKAYALPDGRERELWSNDDKNREAMLKFFGLEFEALEEAKKEEESEDEDSNKDNNGNDLPFGNEE